MIIWIDFPHRLTRNSDVDRGEILHGFGDVVAVVQLKIVGDIFERLFELCSVMLTGVVKGIEFNFLGLPLDFSALLLHLVPSMAVAAVVIPSTLTDFGVVVAGIVNLRLIFLPHD